MAQQVAPGQRVLEESTVVDADVHLTVQGGVLSEKTLRRYVDDKYLDRVRAPSAFPQSYGSDQTSDTGDRIDREDKLLTDPELVEELVCEGLHVDYPLLNTNPGVQKLPDADLAVHLMEAFNDYLLDHFLDDTDFLGLAGITQQKPHKAAEEFDRLGDEKQIVGAYIGSTGPRSPLGHPKFDIMYEAAEDNDLHIAYHGAAGDKFRYDFPKQNQGIRTFITKHSLAHLWSQSLTLTSLVTNGVPEKFPDLNFTFLESGLSWVPHVVWHLNREAERNEDVGSLLDRKPEEYVGESFYFASQPLGEPERAGQLQDVIDVIGVDAVMFSSDYPHWDFDHPSELDKHLRSILSEEEREKVLWETAKEAFQLDI